MPGIKQTRAPLKNTKGNLKYQSFLPAAYPVRIASATLAGLAQSPMTLV